MVLVGIYASLVNTAPKGLQRELAVLLGHFTMKVDLQMRQDVYHV